jgi:hypothetical protein
MVSHFAGGKTVIEFFLQIVAMYPKARLNIFGDKFETSFGAED